MALPEITSSPQIQDYGLVYSKESRQAAGIPRDNSQYIDAYNQMRMAAYNNAYNYWLWQQQAEYNNPSNQVARLKAAGLNPNFNSIDGAGNVGNMPTSSGTVAPSIGSNRSRLLTARTQAVLGSVNAILNSVGQGVDSISRLSDLPPLDSLGEYRRLILRSLRGTVKGKEYDNIQKMINGLTSFVENGGQLDGKLTVNLPYSESSSATDFYVFDPRSGVNYKTLQQKLNNLGIDYNIKNLVKDAKSYYNDNIQPKEKEIISGKAGMSVAGEVIGKIARGETEDLTFKQMLMAILVLSLNR